MGFSQIVDLANAFPDHPEIGYKEVHGYLVAIAVCEEKCIGEVSNHLIPTVPDEMQIPT